MRAPGRMLSPSVVFLLRRPSSRPLSSISPRPVPMPASTTPSRRVGALAFTAIAVIPAFVFLLIVANIKDTLSMFAVVVGLGAVGWTFGTAVGAAAEAGQAQRALTFTLLFPAVLAVVLGGLAALGTIVMGDAEAAAPGPVFAAVFGVALLYGFLPWMVPSVFTALKLYQRGRRAPTAA